MTDIFCFGAIDLTDIFGISSPEQVKEELRPYLYYSAKGHYLLNVSLKNKKKASEWGHTHVLEASIKGEKKTARLCDLKEFLKESRDERPQQAQQQPQPQQGGGYNGYSQSPNYSDINF